VLSAAACSTDTAPETPPLINDYVTGIEVLGDAAASQEVINKQLGDGDADGPEAQIEETATVINGGSVQESITSDDPFAKLRVGLEPLTSAEPSASSTETSTSRPSLASPPTPTGTPSKGYHEITLKNEGTDVSVVMTIAQALPGQQFVFYFAIVDKSGKQGKLSKQTVEALKVGTGEVQVSISWDVDSDVDLHVEDPSGDEVYWRDDEVASGGKLDLDSNADCDLDHKRNENITWQTAPPGKYIVRVDHYMSCGQAKTNYVVTIQAIGQPARTFHGTLTGDGDQGDAGAGSQIATFTVNARTGDVSPS
jgi:hypothetical protein